MQTVSHRKFLDDRARRYEGFECRLDRTPEQRVAHATDWLLIVVVAVGVGLVATYIWAVAWVWD